jgi:NAD+ kinase
MRPRVLILRNVRKPAVAELIESLREWIAEQAEIVDILPADGEPLAERPQADVCLVFGGDGTLLSAARMLAAFGLPLLGVNVGKLGFLAEFSVAGLRAHLGEILSGQVQPSERLMLSARVVSCGEVVFDSPVANDLAISAGPPFRMVDLKVSEADDPIAQYFADGLVVSTPTGSTGYNMSVGGPIMVPALEAVVVSPIAPHSLSMRPIVLDGTRPIRIHATEVNEGTAVIVDGQVSSQLCEGALIEVRRAAVPMRTFAHPGRSFFDTLTRKLQWGRSPRHPSA